MLPAVELIYFTGCRHLDRTRWQEWDQYNSTTPERVQGYASPTVLVGGRDVTGGERTNAAPACRAAGGPSAGVIRAALAALGPGAVDAHRPEVDPRDSASG